MSVPASPALAALLGQAWSALQQGRWPQALDPARRATELEPGSFDGWRMRGIAALQSGRLDEARAALQHAHALRPDDAGTVMDLGSVLLDSEEVDTALPLLRRATELLADDPRSWFRLGAAAYRAGRFDEAVRGFEGATRRRPDWLAAWNNLAATRGRLGEYEAAVAAARNALAIDPQAAEGHYALAALLSNFFDRPSLQQGLQAAEQALRLAPASADAHRIAAILLRKLDEPVRAERHAREAVRLAPADAANVDILGEQLLTNARPADAVATYEAAFDRGVDGTALRRQHGIALLQDGRPGPAREALERALRQAPDDQRAIAHLGVATRIERGAQAAAELLGLHRHVRRIALPTPPGFADADAFHRAMAGDIRQHSRQRWEPVGLAARNAYLSGDLLADRSAAIVGFEQRLREAIDAFIAACRHDPDDLFLRNVPRDYVLHVWATQAAETGYIDTHIHEESWLSGAYYVSLPDAIGPDDPGHAGWIEFGRPYGHLPAPDPASLHLECPRVGDLLLFPSYLFHRTLPYRGGGERISISFDLAAV